MSGPGVEGDRTGRSAGDGGCHSGGDGARFLGDDGSRPPAGDGPRRPTTLREAFGFAFRGIGRAIAVQRNMKIHLAVAAIALVLCAALRCAPVEWAVVIAMIGAVLSAELINSALENVVDLVSPGYHELAGWAKDMAAGAVLVLAIAAAVVGAVIYLSALMRIL